MSTVSNWAQVKPLEQNQIHCSCLCCGPAGRILHPGSLLAVGFGDCIATKGDDYVYSETEQNHKNAEPWTLDQVEDLAKADPDHDWRIEYIGPLHGEVYQRHKSGRWAGQWVCIKSNQGFA